MKGSRVYWVLVGVAIDVAVGGRLRDLVVVQVVAAVAVLAVERHVVGVERLVEARYALAVAAAALVRRVPRRRRRRPNLVVMVVTSAIVVVVGRRCCCYGSLLSTMLMMTMRRLSVHVVGSIDCSSCSRRRRRIIITCLSVSRLFVNQSINQ